MKKRYSGLIKKIALLATVFVIIWAGNSITTHTVYAATKTIKVTPTKIPEKVKKYPNYNKYTKYTVAFNYYMQQLEAAGGGKFIIKKGTYTMSNAVYVPSNVTIILQDGVVLKNIYETGDAGYEPSTTIFMLCPYSKGHVKNATKKYNSSKNVVIEGRGNAIIDNNYVEGGATITCAHNNGVTITGITFTHENGGHFIELSGVKNATITNNVFKNAKKSTRNKYYCKEAINIDTADPNTHGLSAEWVKQDKTPCKNVTIENNVFSNVNRGVGTHKYSQKNGNNVYHKNIKILNNTFKNIFDNGVFILNWKNTTIKGNKFNKIGLNSKKSYSSGLHAISGGGVNGINITENVFKNIARNPVYFGIQRNVGAGSEYSTIGVYITDKQATAMVNNVATDCGTDINDRYEAYEILFFKGNGKRTVENGIGIDLDEGTVGPVQ